MNDALRIEATGTHSASVIWLHGLGADGNDFAPIVPELGLPAESGIRFIFPHAPMQAVTINGGMLMRSWYDIKDPDLSKGRERADFDASGEILKSFIQAELDAGIPANKIVIAGFSQGGAITLHTGLHYPQQLAGLLVLSSYLPFPEVLDEEAAKANSTTPILMAHGEQDPVIPIGFAKQSFETLKERNYPINWQSYAMQHGVCLEEIELIAKWLTQRLLT